MLGPLFSVLTPVHDPPPDVLAETIASVRAQTFADWELILVDDGSRSEDVHAVLRAAVGDDRITVITRAENGGIVAASNDALAAASGDFVVPVDHDDLLTPEALDRVAAAVTETPQVDYLYSDEDKYDPSRGFCDRFAKPEFSPERLRGQAYPTHLSALRRDLVNTLGGYRPGFDGAQDYDLILRVAERARRIVHIPEVLYHWRIVPGSTAGEPHAKPYAWEAGRRAIQEHLNRSDIRGRAHLGARPGFYRAEYFVDPTRTVSLVVRTAGRPEIIRGERVVPAQVAVRSVLARAGVTVGEIVVVGSPAVVAAFTPDPSVPLVPVVVDADDEASPAAWNAGVAAAGGEFVVLCDEAVEATSARFLETLVGPLLQEDVGLVGPQVLHPDGRLVDAGLVVRRHGWAPLLPDGAPDDPGPFGAALLAREVSALNPACLAARRSTLEAVGGFSERLDGPASAIDLAIKLRHQGKRLVWTPHARVVSFRASLPAQVASVDLRVRWTIPADDACLPRVDLPASVDVVGGS